jgi:hypothetical protein
MVYVPIRTVEQRGYTLVESTDLTKVLSTFIGKKVFLVLEKNRTKYVIDLAKVLLNETELVLTNTVSSALTNRLSDLFVTRYLRTDIPVTNINGTYDNRLRVFNPISYKDYRVNYTSVDTPNDIDNPIRKGFLDDLVISASSPLTNKLVAVNGVFHRTTLFQDKLYVLDGFRTMRISNFKDVTMVDTSKIGGHTVIPLTSGNVSQTTYNGLATIDAGVSLKDKTVFLVVDGYFYHMDTEVFYLADSNHLKVKTNKLPLISQLRHNPRTLQVPDRFGEDASQNSRKYNDDYADLFLNNRSVPANTFTTRDFQYSRLTHYHSFLVVINNPSLFCLSTVLLPTGTPQLYSDMSMKVSSGVMSYGEGLCPSYLILRDPHGRKSVFIQRQDYSRDYQNDTVNPAYIPGITQDLDTGPETFCRFVDYASV